MKSTKFPPQPNSQNCQSCLKSKYPPSSLAKVSQQGEEEAKGRRAVEVLLNGKRSTSVASICSTIYCISNSGAVYTDLSTARSAQEIRSERTIYVPRCEIGFQSHILESKLVSPTDGPDQELGISSEKTFTRT